MLEINGFVRTSNDSYSFFVPSDGIKIIFVPNRVSYVGSDEEALNLVGKFYIYCNAGDYAIAELSFGDVSLRYIFENYKFVKLLLEA